MSNINQLLVNSKDTIINEGFFSFAKKTGSYISTHIGNGSAKGNVISEVKDVLFINGCTLPHPSRYRVSHQREQIEANGYTTDEVFYENLTLEMQKYYRAFVFYRCPVTDVIKDFIKKAKYNNKAVFYDIDDLVFDKKYTSTIEYVNNMSEEDKKLYYDGVRRMGETLDLCDYAITTTEELAKELKPHVKEVYVNRNAASERMCELSQNAMTNKQPDESRIYLGYLSGSITHNPDFELIVSPIERIMEKYDNVYLKIIGLLDIPEQLNKYKDRIITAPFTDWEKLPSIISTMDVNLAPLEDSLFNKAKSENKWMEAGLVKVPTVASNIGAFKVINSGVDGFLVDNDNEQWFNALDNLIADRNKRVQIGQKANDRVMKEYVTTYSGYRLTKFIKEHLNKSIAFILPTTNISGGVNVVIKHANILRDNGYDVFIINNDNDTEDISNSDGVINVVAEEVSHINCHLDKVVATLWSTLYTALTYTMVDKVAYLVQNYETNFYYYGHDFKRKANATYSMDKVEYLTISKWCKQWLEDDFERECQYAPNGIKLDNFPITERDFSGKIRILVEGNSDDYYKNVDESFRIIKKLDKEKYEVYYLSYQGEPKKWYYVDKFLNKVPYDEVGKIYNSADILIKSSILESFSYPPLEMMATGGIAIVAPNSGNAEYLKDGSNCLLYNPGDIDDAVEKVEIVSRDAKLREKLIKGGLETARERSWSNIEKEILELYNMGEADK